jgi:hypothetical protein
MKSFLLLSILLCSTVNLAAQGVIYECSGGRANAIPLCKKTDSSNAGNGYSAAAAAKPARTLSSLTSPGDFPRVSENAQKARDSDRKQILLDELHAEDRKLNSLIREYNNGAPERRAEEKNTQQYEQRTFALKEDVARTGKNVEALKRELAKLN